MCISFSYTLDCIVLVRNFLNFKGHQNCILSSKVKVILPNVGIWNIGGVALGGVCYQRATPSSFIVKSIQGLKYVRLDDGQQKDKQNIFLIEVCTDKQR